MPSLEGNLALCIKDLTSVYLFICFLQIVLLLKVYPKEISRSKHQNVHWNAFFLIIVKQREMNWLYDI